jgi:hypothetical protein
MVVPNDGGPVYGTGLQGSACSFVSTLSGCQIALGVYFMFLSNTEGAVPDAATMYALGVFVPPPAGGACSTSQRASLGPSCG